MRHRRGGIVEVHVGESHGKGRIRAVVDRELEELDRGPAEAELVQEVRPQGVRVVEGQALRLDVAFTSAESEPGIPVREAGRLDPVRLLVAVPREEAVRCRQVVIDLDVELVVLAVFDRVEQVVVDGLSVVGLARAGRVGLRIELGQDVACHQVDAVTGNDVALKRLSGRRVVNDTRQLGKVAPPHGQARHRRESRHSLCLAAALVVAEEERLVLEHRAAEGAAELILREIGLGTVRAVVEEVVRVEGIVAVELEAAAVQLVRTGLDLQVDYATQRAAEFRGIGGGLELELVQGIDARKDHDGLEPGLVVVDAIEHVVVVARALTVGGKRGGGTPGHAAGAVDVRARNSADDAGN